MLRQGVVVSQTLLQMGVCLLKVELADHQLQQMLP